MSNPFDAAMKLVDDDTVGIGVCSSCQQPSPVANNHDGRAVMAVHKGFATQGNCAGSNMTPETMIEVFQKEVSI